MSAALSEKQLETLQTFQSITNIESTEECRQLLASHDWNIDHAIGTALAMKEGGGGGGGGGGRSGAAGSGEAAVAPARPQSEPQRLTDPILPSAAFAQAFMGALRQNMQQQNQLPPRSTSNGTLSPAQVAANQQAAAAAAAAAAASASASSGGGAAAQPIARAQPNFMNSALPSSAGGAAASRTTPQPNISMPRTTPAPAASANASAAPSVDRKDVKSAPAAATPQPAAAAAPAAKSWYQSIPGAGLVSGLVGGVYRFGASFFTAGGSDAKSPPAGPGGAAAGTSSASETEQFLSAFEAKYVGRHPRIMHSSYAEAIRAAKASNRMLFVYLHSDVHDDTDRFCGEVLCAETFRDFLNENFVTWMGSIKHSDAYRLSSQLNVASFPFIAVLSPQGNNQLAVVHHRSGAGTLNSDLLLAELVQTMDVHRQRTAAANSKQANAARDRQLIAAQDREYKEAERADKLKAAASASAEVKARERRENERRIAEERKKQDAVIAEQKREREIKIENEKKARAAAREARRSALPTEPAAPAPDVAAVRVQLLNGSKVTRRFFMNTRLGTVIDWIETHELNTPASASASASAASAGDEKSAPASASAPAAAAAAAAGDSEIPPADVPIQVVSTHPRRVFTDSELELKQLGLGRQILLIVEERDSGAAATAAAAAAAAPAPADSSLSAAANDASPSPQPSPNTAPQSSPPAGSLGGAAGGMTPLALARGSSGNRPTSKLVTSLTRQPSNAKTS